MYRHTQVAEKYIDTLLTKGGRRGKSFVQVAHRHNPYGKGDKGYGHIQSLYARAHKAQSSYGGQARPNRQRVTLTWQWQDPAGRQRTSPTRAPTRTSRRAGNGQGDLLHTKDATSASRMHGNHKEQYSSHSLNRWKERFALQHRHAGMSTGSEPYTLRGVLSKGA